MKHAAPVHENTHGSAASDRPTRSESQGGSALAPPRYGIGAQRQVVWLGLRSKGIQAKLTVGEPDDAYEQEADRAADRILRMTHPMPGAPEDPGSRPHLSTLQRTCERCDEEKLRRKPIDADEEQTPRAESEAGPDVSPALEAQIHGLSAGGSPLPESVRSFFEPRFGYDLRNVRVHADASAADSARSLGARAYTLGRDIVFGSGQYAPRSHEGRRLIAHELAHTIQQRAVDPGGSAPLQLMSSELAHVPSDVGRIQREPYETRGIALDRTQIATMAGQSYWEQRTLTRYAAAFDSRMNADPEERDAVLASLWQMSPPATVRRREVRVVPVAARTLPLAAGQTTPAQAPELLYRFTFDPPARGDPRPRLEIAFVGRGAGSRPLAAPAAPTTYTPTRPALTFAGFPSRGTQPDDYWSAHPAEHRALFQWMETTAPATFDQVVTTETAGRRGSVSHRSVFRVRGSHSGTTLSGLRIDLVSQGPVSASQSVPADYRDRDMGDLELERLQATSRRGNNRLGTVTLPTTIPADERLPVKYAIWQYFDSGRARNTEIDAIVPVGTGTRRVLYTLAFGAGNDVTVTRIGEAGTRTGMVNVERIDVRRVRGFPGASAATSALRTWWATRYPRAGAALTADPPAPARGRARSTAPTAAVLIGEMNQRIGAGVASRSWFAQNYGIEVLDAAGTATRLQTAHSVPARLTTDTIDFDATDLLMLELSLQTLTDSEINALRGVQLGRKTGSLGRTRAGFRAGSANQYGVTLTNGSGATQQRTVLYFASLYANNERLFRGSTAGNALPDVTMGILHELGHAAGQHAGIEAAFTAWLRRNRQTAPTWYAATGASERFPEFYALFHTDPHFLCNRYPEVYAWFDALATTGAPPAASATLPTPTCPA